MRLLPIYYAALLALLVLIVVLTFGRIFLIRNYCGSTPQSLNPGNVQEIGFKLEIL